MTMMAECKGRIVFGGGRAFAKDAVRDVVAAARLDRNTAAVY